MMDYQLVFRSHLCSSILQNGILVMPRDDRGLVAGTKAVMLREKIDEQGSVGMFELIQFDLVCIP